MTVSPNAEELAAGHSDGSIKLWSTRTWEPRSSAAGHRSGVSALRFSHSGVLLASGGQDTSIVVWDSQQVIPLYRLQGHLGQITDLVRPLTFPLHLAADFACHKLALLYSPDHATVKRNW